MLYCYIPLHLTRLQQLTQPAVFCGNENYVVTTLNAISKHIGDFGLCTSLLYNYYAT